jgi:hypothetical protein
LWSSSGTTEKTGLRRVRGLLLLLRLAKKTTGWCCCASKQRAGFLLCAAKVGAQIAEAEGHDGEGACDVRLSLVGRKGAIVVSGVEDGSFDDLLTRA